MAHACIARTLRIMVIVSILLSAVPLDLASASIGRQTPKVGSQTSEAGSQRSEVESLAQPATLNTLPSAFSEPSATLFQSPLPPPPTPVTPTLDSSPITSSEEIATGEVVTSTQPVSDTDKSPLDGNMLMSDDDLGKGWQLLYNPPSVALFSGAATYNYPIKVPAGRNGLQPSLNLSYNSRRIDGILGWIESDWVGLGWSLDTVDIVRHYTHVDKDTHLIDYNAAFDLLLNGTGYKLYPGAGVVNHGRYYAKDAPWLYVLRVNDLCTTQDPCDGFTHGSDNNLTGEYWIVRLPNGTQVKLGSRSNSEQVEYPATCNTTDKYCGHTANWTVYRWRADTFTDVYNNQMDFTYTECLSVDDTHPERRRESASWPAEIHYNNYGSGQWATTVQFQTGPCERQPLGISTEADDIFGVAGQLNSIEVYNMGQPIQSVHLGYYNTWSVGVGSLLRRLTSIQTFNGSDSQSLPATTFAYTDYNNKRACNPADPNCDPNGWKREHFAYPRLTQVNNGYEATDTFSYVNDGRADDSFLGFSYRVNTHTTSDGIHNLPATQSYAYGRPCYNALEGSGTHCNSPDSGLSLVGFDVVTETVTGYDNEWLAKAAHHFRVDDATPESPLLGREYRAQALNASNGVLKQTDTLWTSATFGNNVPFVYTAAISETTTANGNDIHTRTDYTYDNYGNQTAEYNYGAEEPVNNAGFEAGSAGWAFFGNPSPASIAAGTAFAGQSSVQLQGSATGGAYQDIGGLTPGTTYVVRAWVMATSGATGKFALWLHDTTGNNSVISPASTPSTSWTQVSLNYTANATGKVRVHLYYSAAGSGTIYADAVAIAVAQEVGDERSTYRFYFNLTDNGRWFIGLKWAENIYEGVALSNNLAALKTQAIWYYDDDTYNAANWGQSTQIDQGQVTMEGRGRWNASGQPYVTTSYDYDSWGNRTLVIDPLGHATNTAYEGTYNLYPMQTWNALLQYTTIEYYGINGVPADYGLPGQVKKVIDPNGAVTQYQYDAFGRLNAAKAPDDPPGWEVGQVTVYVRYPGEGQVGLQRSVTKRGRDATWQEDYYDGLGRTIQTHQKADNGQEVRVTTQYDAFGRAVTQYVPYTGTHGEDGGYGTYGYVPPAGGLPSTTTQYDALGRVTLVTNPDSTTTTYVYGIDRNDPDPDFAGGRQVVYTIKPNLYFTRQSFDAFGQLQTVSENYATYPTWSNEARTRYTYDVLGNLKQVTDAAGNITTMSYDALGRKIEMTDPDMGHWHYQYNGAGNLTVQDDAKHQRTCFSYDALNRLTGKAYTNDTTNCPTYPTVIYGYDAGTYGKGQRTAMSNANDTTSWAYDSRGRPTHEAKTINGVGTYHTYYTYDAMDRVTSTTYPGGEVVNTTYNAQGLPSNVAGTNTYLSSAAYNALGQFTSTTYGNSVATSYDYYDTTGEVDPVAGVAYSYRLKNITLSGGSVGMNLTYRYDKVGNVKALADNLDGTKSQTLGYDALDRLTSAVGGYGTKSYTYNTIGNLLSKDGRTYTYSGSTHKVTGDGTYTYEYDANGNIMTRKLSGAADRSFVYNTDNKIAQVKDGAGSFLQSNVYDADGNRVKKLEGYQNLAAGISATSGGSLYWPGVVTDGDTWANSGSGDSGQFAFTSQGGLHYVQLDLGATYTVDKVKVWHYASDGRTYHNTKTQVSANGTTWVTVFDSATSGEYAETSTGRTTTFTAQNVRYVRDYLNGSNANGGNHWVEIEVWGSQYQNLAKDLAATSSGTLHWPGAATNGDTWANSGTGDSGEFAFTLQSGLHYVQLDLGAVYTVDKVKVWHYAGDGRTYHGTKTQVSANGSTWVTVFDSAGSGEYAETSAGRTTTFAAQGVRYVRDYLNGSTVNAGNHWVEIEVWGQAGSGTRTTVYVNPYYEEEWTNGTKTNTVKYYYVGGQRIAIRDNDGLKYVHTDQLGSASRVSNTSGALVRGLWYDPWGNTVDDTGSAADRYKFTGQEQDNARLYDYNARAYDPTLGRFLSADTIVPDPANPQTLNRYSYVLNNPVKYTDPTGHWENESPGYSIGYEQLLPLSAINSMSRQGAVLYARNYIAAKYDFSPAQGVAVKYAPDGVNTPQAANVNIGPEDMYINMYEKAFGAAQTTADLIGVLYHETVHSHQERQIEKDKGTNVWLKPATVLGCREKMTVDGKTYITEFTTEGQRFQAAAEIEASNEALALQLGYSDKFLQEMGGYSDLWSNRLEKCSWFFYPQGYQWGSGSPRGR